MKLCKDCKYFEISKNKLPFNDCSGRVRYFFSNAEVCGHSETREPIHGEKRFIQDARDLCDGLRWEAK